MTPELELNTGPPEVRPGRRNPGGGEMSSSGGIRVLPPISHLADTPVSNEIFCAIDSESLSLPDSSFSTAVKLSPVARATSCVVSPIVFRSWDPIDV